MQEFEKYYESCVEDIQRLVRIDSAQAPALPGMPFGKGAADSLSLFLDIAAKMGFETKNYDNYIGEVIFGEGEEFAILSHLDVVPAGSGWTHGAFSGEIANGKLYGRGTSDDKGPAVICLHCMKMLKDEGFQPHKKIKLIVGCNEESGWECIAHYNKVAHMPAMGFSPDADFPVIRAEKGILQLRLHFPLKNAPFAALNAGERANMVCDFARAEGAVFEKAEAQLCGLEIDGDSLCARGRAAHASTPEEGDNALGKLLAFFARSHAEIANIHSLLFEDGLGLTELHDDTGRLTLSPDMATYEGNELIVTVDIRYPSTHSHEEVLRAFRHAGIEYEITHHQLPLYNSADSPLVAALRRVYEEETGESGEPIAIGGGTYARALTCGAGFGPQFPGEPSTIHQKDEYISLENVRKLLRIYRAAIRELTR